MRGVVKKLSRFARASIGFLVFEVGITLHCIYSYTFLYVTPI